MQNPNRQFLHFFILFLNLIASVVPGPDHHYNRGSGMEDVHTFTRNLIIKKKPVGTLSPVSSSSSSSSTLSSSSTVNKLNKPVVTTFKPMIVPKFSHNSNNNNIINSNSNSNSQESQWVHGLDQIQIESQPPPNNHRWHSLTRRPPVQPRGYDLTTLMIVSIVSAFLGALTFSVVDSGQRSMGGGSPSIGSFSSLLNVLDVDTVHKFLTNTLADWEGKLTRSILNTEYYKNNHNNDGKVTNKKNNSVETTTTRATPSSSSRTTRETKTTIKNAAGFFRWLVAYKKDPVELRCIQKMVCQTIASSSCARSINTDLVGGSVMNILKYFVTSAGDLTDVITDTLQNPNKCLEIMTSNQFCNDYEQSNTETTTTTAVPVLEVVDPLNSAVNLTSITPRLRHIL